MRYKGRSRRQRAADIGEGALIGALAVWICFRSLFFLPLILIFIPFFVRYKDKKRKHALSLQRQTEFKNVMTMLYSVTAAGGTLEKAFREALRDMRGSPDRYPLMIPEFERICFMLERNVPMENALEDFGERSGDDDIRHFAGILAIAGRSGGSLADIVKRSAEAVSLRIDMNSEIDTILAGRKAELKVMVIVPAGILLYMELSSPDYMSVLYESIAGHMIMAAALAVYIAAVLIGRRILEFQ